MNRLQNLSLVASLLLAAPLLQAAGPAATSYSHPIVGTWSWVTFGGSWSWVTFGGSCTETWQFRANQTMLGTSAEEVSEKKYTIAAKPDKQGFYKLVETVIRHNDKKDCSGVMGDGPGEKTTRFIQFSPQGEQLLVCQTAALTACFGPLKRVP